MIPFYADACRTSIKKLIMLCTNTNTHSSSRFYVSFSVFLPRRTKRKISCCMLIEFSTHSPPRYTSGTMSNFLKLLSQLSSDSSTGKLLQSTIWFEGSLRTQFTNTSELLFLDLDMLEIFDFPNECCEHI